MEKVKLILSQFNNSMNDFQLNNDFNDSLDLNNNNFSVKSIRKISLGNSPVKKRISQATTNNKTCSSFNSGNNSSIINNSNICEILNKNGWNAWHYASYLGFDEILEYILKKYKSKLATNLNIYLINNEGWSPLLLAVFK